MEYNIKLINVYTSLRHSDLLDGKVGNDSMLYFQNLLNRSLPSTPTERLVFQTHRQLLKVSTPESIAIITKTKLWHLCLCASIPVLRTILNVPDDIVVTYEKTTGYHVTTRLTRLNEEFPVLKETDEATTAKPREKSPLKNGWVNVSKRNIENTSQYRRQPNKQESKQDLRQETKQVRILKRDSSLTQQPVTTQQTQPAQPTAAAIQSRNELLEDTIKELKDMPSQNWADANDDALDENLY